MGDFEDAKDKVLMGTERRSMIISEAEKRTTAYHEAGHALVARCCRAPIRCTRSRSFPRARARRDAAAPDRGPLSMSRDFAENRIAILMGGRVAEELIFNQVTTGAGNDIEVATDTARRMVCEWGMSDKLGPLTFGKKVSSLPRSRDQPAPRLLRADGHRDRPRGPRFVMEGYATATKLVREHIDQLKALAEALLER
jgi:cell division protease FtsH